VVGGINWENGSIRPKASNTKQCKQLLDISHDHVLEQMVSKHTYITESSQSTLDLIFANNSTFINKVEVILGISDHEVVYVESSLRPDKTKKPSRKILLYNKANKQHLRQNITIVKTMFIFISSCL